jgi:3-isopropylmalate/(R)-2-methylmalate dehydratase small subunit
MPRSCSTTSATTPTASARIDANRAKNGLLTVALPIATCTSLRAMLHAAPGITFAVDLETQTVTDGQGGVHRFDISPIRKRCLLNGYDDISRTQEYRPAIEAFESRHRASHPWMFR